MALASIVLGVVFSLAPQQPDGVVPPEPAPLVLRTEDYERGDLEAVAKWFAAELRRSRDPATAAEAGERARHEVRNEIVRALIGGHERLGRARADLAKRRAELDAFERHGSQGQREAARRRIDDVERALSRSRILDLDAVRAAVGARRSDPRLEIRGWPRLAFSDVGAARITSSSGTSCDALAEFVTLLDASYRSAAEQLALRRGSEPVLLALGERCDRMKALLALGRAGSRDALQAELAAEQALLWTPELFRGWVASAVEPEREAEPESEVAAGARVLAIGDAFDAAKLPASTTFTVAAPCKLRQAGPKGGGAMRVETADGGEVPHAQALAPGTVYTLVILGRGEFSIRVEEP